MAMVATVSGCTTPTQVDEPQPEQGESATVQDVVDGDTLWITTDDGRRDKVRIVGIDTPETYGDAECWGPEATQAAQRLAPEGSTITLFRDLNQPPRDRYDRRLAYIELQDGTDLGETMVQLGHARNTTRTGDTRHRDYTKAARQAETNQLGLYRSC